MTTRAEIEAEFEGVRDPAVLKGLARLCDSFRVTPEELSAEWDIVELKTSRPLSLDASHRRLVLLQAAPVLALVVLFDAPPPLIVPVDSLVGHVLGQPGHAGPRPCPA